MDEMTVRELASSFDAALNSKDINAMMARYADGAVRMNPNTPMSVGKDAIRAWYLDDWTANDFRVTNEISDIRISDDLAAVRGMYTSTVTPRSGSAYEDRGKWSAAAQKQSDGSWKMLWEIWSSDLPPRATPRARRKPKPTLMAAYGDGRPTFGPGRARQLCFEAADHPPRGSAAKSAESARRISPRAA
jgi:ketosteroid isomerase-like protein